MNVYILFVRLLGINKMHAYEISNRRFLNINISVSTDGAHM